ncbi:MAG: iron(II)-dependent oxidoreductase [Chlamydiales bacterium]|jgi:iron(II)-dependent oxidoreductase
MSSGSTRPAQDLIDLAQDVRRRTLALVADLSDEQLSVPLMEIVNPLLWELGHVAFFSDHFVLRELGWTSQPMFEHAQQLFDSTGVEHDSRWGLSLPSRAGVLDYLERVQQRIAEGLLSSEPSARATQVMLLSVLHEDMHGEALTYTRQTLGYPAPPDCGTGAQLPRIEDDLRRAGDVHVPGGVMQLGSRADAACFVFDNEQPIHEVSVAPFEIARTAVTEAQFEEFVQARGYQREEFWCSAGWVWRESAGLECPSTWRRVGASWLRRRFDQESCLEEHAPICHVNWFEAQAYCRWAGRRLPSETEWELAATGGAPREPAPLMAADATPGGRLDQVANLDGHLGRCADVGAFVASASPYGCLQMVGNVWEWTASAFGPYPGFVAGTPYRDYSEPWFGDRKVLRGGAWATASRLASARYRNFFPPYRNDIFAGFRTCAP